MRQVLLHGHIFKNAGTTLDWSLQRCFGDKFLEHRDDPKIRQNPESELREVLQSDDLQALSSHSMPCPAPEIQGVRFSELVLLRHPLKRVRSVYEFERNQQAETPGALAAKEKNYADYVHWRMQAGVGATIRNFQTRFVCGGRARNARFDPGPEQFFSSIANIERSALTGIVERYDESMVVFESVLSQHFPGIDLSYVPQNVTRQRFGGSKKAWDEDLGDVKNELIEKNAYDLALYEHANQRLTASIEQVTDFSARLQAFKQRCAALR
ncbi:MAG: hypothetical protein Cons2KO_06890 [Congregibacter sp.]